MDDLISRSAALAAVETVPHTADQVSIYDIKDELKNLPAVDAGPTWISVKDRLPEDLPENKGKKVIPCLVSLKSTYPNGKPNTQKRQRQLQYYGSEGWVWEWSRIGASRVTHWMPLPEPPKEGEI